MPIGSRLVVMMAGVMFAWLQIALPGLLGRAAFIEDENPTVTRLLADTRDKAAVVAKDADELDALTRTEATWHAHAAKLEELRQHINDLAKATEQLQASRDSASPWQRQAIDRMMPLLKELATNTTAAINHVAQNQTRPVSPSYAAYLRANTDAARELAATISDFVQYGQAMQKLQSLEQKLEVASK